MDKKTIATAIFVSGITAIGAAVLHKNHKERTALKGTLSDRIRANETEFFNTMKSIMDRTHPTNVN